jgi:hypothetical protein
MQEVQEGLPLRSICLRERNKQDWEKEKLSHAAVPNKAFTEVVKVV